MRSAASQATPVEPDIGGRKRGPKSSVSRVFGRTGMDRRLVCGRRSLAFRRTGRSLDLPDQTRAETGRSPSLPVRWCLGDGDVDFWESRSIEQNHQIQAIANRLEAIALRLEAIAVRFALRRLVLHKKTSTSCVGHPASVRAVPLSRSLREQ